MTKNINKLTFRGDMPIDTNNKRSNMRHLISVPIRLTDSKGNEYQVMTDNVSDCGLFLLFEQTPFPEVGEIVEVQVLTPLGDGSEAPINKAKVVRHDPVGIGLRFLLDK